MVVIYIFFWKLNSNYSNKLKHFSILNVYNKILLFFLSFGKLNGENILYFPNEKQIHATTVNRELITVEFDYFLSTMLLFRSSTLMMKVMKIKK